MKTKKTAPAVTSTGGKINNHIPQTSLDLRCDYRKDSFECWPRPKELELASLAAQLAGKTKINPRQLVQDAWALYWESCRTIQEDYLKVEEYFAQEGMENHEPDEDANDEVRPDIPQPKTFPITFKKVQILLLPEMDGRPAKRKARFHEYFDAQLAIQKDLAQGIDSFLPTSKPTKNEVAREFARWQRTGFDEVKYLRFATDFLKWHNSRKAADDDFKRRVGAMVRWGKISPEQLAELRAHGLLGESAKAGKKSLK